MSTARADLVISGQVVVSAEGGRLTMAETVAIGGGRVVAVGSRPEVLDAVSTGIRHLEFPGSAVVPGLHDFHLHLVGMARARRDLRLDGVTSSDELVSKVAEAAVGVAPEGWLRGGGWHGVVLDDATAARLNAATAATPALLQSHDMHSAWASPRALALAGVGPGTADPAGGRIEKDSNGQPTGVLRERATDLVEPIAPQLASAQLRDALDECLAELAALGLTGATDAGDTTSDGGIGAYAALGDRPSQLLVNAERIDGRLRLNINLPADAVAAARELGVRSGEPIAGATTIRGGWVKVYLDGALGSQTAACFDPYTCPPSGNRGILRLEPDEVHAILHAAADARLAVAMHAIGDRAAAQALDALQTTSPATTAARPRLEHLQLLRAADRLRLATVDATASVQPVHAVADQETSERCWADRLPEVYPLRSLAEAGARLAFGSDAPIESVNPWEGILAAVRRRVPAGPDAAWRPEEAIDLPTALSAYTSGPAQGIGAADEGHLRPGARADLAVLNVDLQTLREADENLAATRSLLTVVDGREVHRG